MIEYVKSDVETQFTSEEFEAFYKLHIMLSFFSLLFCSPVNSAKFGSSGNDAVHF